VPGAYACLESSADLLAERLIAAYGRTDTFRLRNGLANAADWGKVNHALTKIERLRIHAFDRTATLAQLTAWGESCVEAGAGFVVVDNLKQVDHGHSHSGSQAERFMALSAGMVTLRKRLGVPVFALHHLDEEGRVRWSKELENDADTLLFLTERDAEHVNVHVRKQRNGARGTDILLRFNKPFQTFESADIGGDAMEGGIDDADGF
jgi:replicative DNA helicase